MSVFVVGEPPADPVPLCEGLEDAADPLPETPGSPARTAAAITMVVSTLAVLGLVLVYSSSSVGIALRVSDATFFLRRQLLWVFLAGCAFALARTTSLDELRRWAWPILGCVLTLLLAVLFVGIERGGARRWISLGGQVFQPSELAKLGLVIFTAAYAAGRRHTIRTFRGLIPPLGIIGLVAGLIAVEPDMGTSLLVTAVSTAMLLVAGVRLWHLAVLAVPGVLGLVAFALTKLGYVKRRLAAFFSDGGDTAAIGYQTHQALIAIGSGGPTGLGLGASQQKRLFLPDVHTDFIFALVGEELGFVGALGVLLLFVLLLLYGLRAVRRAQDEFALLLGIGIVLTLGLQALLNVAVATGSVPPKGIALPFVSYGGSHLLVGALAAGVLARVAAEGHAPEDEQDARRAESVKDDAHSGANTSEAISR